MKKRENPNQIINNAIKDFNNLLCDLIDDLQTKSFDVGQREISELCDRFWRELTYFWARNYFKDELFRFAMENPEKAQNEEDIRDFLDTLFDIDELWGITDMTDEEIQEMEDYENYKEEMEKIMNQNTSDYYGDGAGTYCPACGMSQSDRDIRVQPIKKSRQKRYHIYPKRKDPNQIKSMDDFYDYFRDDNETDYGPDLEF